MKDPAFGLNETSKWRKHIHYSPISRLILLSHSSLSKAAEKETVCIGDKRKREERDAHKGQR